MNNSRQSLKDLYKLAKDAKVGTTIKCPSCKTMFVKTNYQQAFCKTQGGTVCKDNYWNNVTPTKRNNTTRISPANAAFMERMEVRRDRMDDEDFDDDPSWDAHKDTF